MRSGSLRRWLPERVHRVITLDAYAASHRAVRQLRAEGRMPKRVRVRSSKYLNNGIEQDHRRVKQRIRPMLGFKRSFLVRDPDAHAMQLIEK